MKAEVQQRDSQVTRPISGGLPVPFYAVALLVCALTSGCQNTASDLSLSSLPEVTDLDFQQTVLEADQPVLVEFSLVSPLCRNDPHPGTGVKAICGTREDPQNTHRR